MAEVASPALEAISPILMLRTIPLDLQLHLKLYVRMMNIVLQYFDGCPNWKTTAGYLTRLVAESDAEATITYQMINTHDDAIANRFRGSPTVLIDGVDPFADNGAPFGLACRVYDTEEGRTGSPSLSQLRDAIERAHDG